MRRERILSKIDRVTLCFIGPSARHRLGVSGVEQYVVGKQDITSDVLKMEVA